MELLIIMALAVGAMFLLSSRTRKQQREATTFRSQLAEGDEVMTASGLFGTVIAVDGDVITLESPSGGRTDWLRGAIAKLATPPYAEESEDDVVEDDEEPYEDEYLDDDAGVDEVEYDDEAADPARRGGADEAGHGREVTGTDAPAQGEAERRA
jgi:preprotein translocase subunit YajC